MNQIFVSAGQNARPNLATATSCPTNGHFAQSVTGVQNDTRPSNVAQKPATSAQTASERKKTQPHLRRTVDQVKEKWRRGDYTPSGYLVELFSAMKAEGLSIVIKSIQKFCEMWEIPRRTFFRAKAKLLLQHRLAEEIHGILTVRLIPVNSEHLYDDKSGTDSDNLGTMSDRSGTDSDNFGTTTPSNPPEDSHFELSPDLDQISNKSLSHPTHPPERDEDNFSQENEEAFREWLLQKASQLPKKPAFINQWIESQAKKPENRQEYLKYRKAQIDRVNFPPAPREMPATLADYVYPLAHFSEEDQRANTLARLQVKWRMDGSARSSAIAEAEKLGFVISAIGIDEA
jgi:hypothetical protein